MDSFIELFAVSPLVLVVLFFVASTFVGLGEGTTRR